MMKGHQFFLLLAAAAVAAWILVRPQSEPHQPSATGETSQAMAEQIETALPNNASIGAAADLTASSASSISSAAIDPATSDVTDHFGRQFDGLLRKSAAGDASAKLALAVGMKYCSARRKIHENHLRLQHQVAELTEKYAREGRTEPSLGFQSLVRSSQSFKAAYDKVESDCAEITDVDLKRRWIFQLEAAKTGDEGAVMDYLEHPAIDPKEAFADATAINAFKAHAAMLLDRQMAEGSIRAHKAYVNAGYDALMKPQDRFHDALSRVIEPDPVRILASDTALGRAGIPGFGRGPDFDAMHQRILDPMQVMEAEALAQRIWPTLTPKRS